MERLLPVYIKLLNANMITTGNISALTKPGLEQVGTKLTKKSLGKSKTKSKKK